MAVYARLIFWPAELYMSRFVSLSESTVDIELVFGLGLMVIFIFGLLQAYQNKKNNIAKHCGIVQRPVQLMIYVLLKSHNREYLDDHMRQDLLRDPLL